MSRAIQAGEKQTCMCSSKATYAFAAARYGRLGVPFCGIGCLLYRLPRVKRRCGKVARHTASGADRLSALQRTALQGPALLYCPPVVGFGEKVVFGRLEVCSEGADLP